MITKENTPRFVCADGCKYDTLKEAQVHDISSLFIQRKMVENAPRPTDTEIAEYLVAHCSEVLDILLTDGRRRKRICKTPAKRKKSAHEKATEALDNAAANAVKNPTMENVAALAGLKPTTP